MVEPLLAQGLEWSNFETTNDILEALKTDKALLWVIHTGPSLEAALVTQLKIDKHGKFFTVWALGGRDIESWIDLHSELEAYAKREGCDRIIHQLRPGFGRLMMKRDPKFKLINMTIEKVI